MLKDILVALAGLLSLVYLINPSAGIIEFIPDNIPFVGNVDEALATSVLLACLRYFGFDPANFFRRKGRAKEDGSAGDDPARPRIDDGRPKLRP
jgi:uncharacterized membrane protein YkvA (DUF1232 family)